MSYYIWFSFVLLCCITAGLASDSEIGIETNGSAPIDLRRLVGIRGSPRCPCIEPWNVAGGGAPKELTYVDSAIGRGCLKAGMNCYPLDYGASMCRAWDINLAPRCADQMGRPLTNPPNFCKQAWCYVQESGCALHSVDSRVFPGYKLSYSYETCGDIDFFHTELLVGTLKGRKFRSGVPRASTTTLITDTAVPGGWSADWLHHLAHKGDFEIIPTQISSTSVQKYPQSTYTACVRDVALGLLDMCYGQFWETPERLAMTVFTPISQVALFYIIVPAGEGHSVGHMISKIFLPFGWSLWLFWPFISVVVGFCMWLFGEVGDQGPLRGTVNGIQKAVLHMFAHGGGYEESTSPAGSVLLVGFSFLCMLGLAAYTANLSSFLLMANLSTGIQGMEDAISQDVQICVLQAASGTVASFYPKAKELLVTVRDWTDLTEYMDRALCGAMLMEPRVYGFMRSGVAPFDSDGPKGHCDKVQVGKVVLTIPTGVPITRDIDHALGYLWSREGFSGKLKDIQEKYTLRESECPVTSGLRTGAVAMTVGDLLGGAIIIAFMVIVAVVLHFTGASKRLQDTRDFADSEDPPKLEGDEVVTAMANLGHVLRARGVKLPKTNREESDPSPIAVLIRDLHLQHRPNCVAAGICSCTVISVVLVIVLIGKLVSWW